MAKRMLIDATHAEETRVVVLKGNRLEHFDFESANKKQLKGNIYLAKVTRVEPSLQAAFVDYGGNRHGFLSFSEIHPDYYQIPIADRKALTAEDAASEEQDADAEATGVADQDGEAAADGEDNGEDKDDDGEASNAASDVEEIGGDEVEETQTRRVRPQRNYRIQEVIKRRQIVLVQVVKEERGTKGAALTTYLSLAGRYCVLVPNSSRGGGISRKIANHEDRKRLRAIANELPVAEGVGVILRTAGMERSKAEIKRDFAYLVKLWESIRQLTFISTAPSLIHEEANLISRTLRDLYDKEIEEIQIEGAEGYRAAKEFMRMLIPSHARRIKAYTETIPLYQRFQVESQLDGLHSSIVRLKSGGYIVINPTEALVAIDVNSGRATRERNIEETATKTNLEAAEEIARQLRLRDLAGLIVIDFIDMENSRNVRTVERCVKEAMKSDRARIQLGRISHFGLLEMSRQRLRSSLLEASSRDCPHCNGSGQIRSTESTALHVLRAIEEEGILARSRQITVHVPSEVALYILNQKRAALIDIEKRYEFSVTLESDDSLIPPDYRLERIQTRTRAEGAEETDEEDEREGEKAGRGRRRRRRGQRGEEGESQITEEAVPDRDAEASDGDSDEDNQAGKTEEGDGEGDGVRKRRRRGKRGGRRRRRASGDQPRSDEAVAAGEDDQPQPEAEAAPADPATAEQPEIEKPAKPRRSRRKPATDKAEAASDDDKDAKPKRARRSRKKAEEKPAAVEETAAPVDDGNGSSVIVDASDMPTLDTPVPVAASADAPKASGRKGWWNRLTS